VPFADVHGARVRYRERGEGQTGAPPVLFIHGAGGSSAIWLSTLARVGAARRRVALDLPGHGQSGGRTASVDDWVSAVGQAAAALCLGRSVLVGHSLGGLVALAAALAFPDKVAGLCLVTTAAALRPSSRLLLRLEKEWARWPEYLGDLAYGPDTPADVRRQSVGLAMGADHEQTLLDYRAASGFDATARLGEIACPTLVVVGEHDQMTPPALGAALAAGIPGAALVRLRSGHFPMHEQPDGFAAALTGFLGT
jgi:pimeloyl-ACP methyl ester carboxylesterase